MRFVAVFILLFLVSCSTSVEQPKKPDAPSIEVESARGRLIQKVAADHILVEKSKRTMKLYSNNKVIREYNISLGKVPIGPKRQQGDNKTPEGNYRIISRKSDSMYHLSLKISYPSEQDKEQSRIMGVEPGDFIMIHGLPADFGTRPRPKDWTFGCIAVTNEEIEEIWRLVPDGVSIEIRP